MKCKFCEERDAVRRGACEPCLEDELRQEEEIGALESKFWADAEPTDEERADEWEAYSEAEQDF